MAEEACDAKFVSKLDEASKQKCRDELNERNPADTLIAVQTLRQRVKEQDWLRIPTDFEFLLRFRRFRKFSQLEQRKALEKFWTVRTSRPEWYSNIDLDDPILQRAMRLGVTTMSPVRDRLGRCLMIWQFEDMDIKVMKDLGMDVLFKWSCVFYDWMTRDENVQTNGVVFIADYTGITMQLFNFMADSANEIRGQVVKPEFRKYIRELSSGKYGVDKNRIPAKSEA
ncbi:clavesin-1-like [Mya arenaria]|uniref:clavesin-1-like n=1 Tax=Mya arenaria TaxID=6604 RepID=UPI0022E0D935|nr:clavesin-1-like [Mya arenaria]